MIGFKHIFESRGIFRHPLFEIADRHEVIFRHNRKRLIKLTNQRLRIKLQRKGKSLFQNYEFYIRKRESYYVNVRKE